MMSISSPLKEQYLWNMAGTLASTLISIVLLFVVTRVGDSGQSDLFGIAYTISQQLIIIGLFGVRPYQSTDVREEHSFSVYCRARFITIVAMLFVLLLYLLLSDFAMEKNLVIAFLTFYRAVEAFSDVFQGFFQQHHRSDLAGKIAFFRSVFSIALFIGVLLGTHSMVWASLALFSGNLFLIVLLDWRFFNHYLGVKKVQKKIDCEFRSAVQVLRACFPLFLNVFLLNAIFSEQKFVIDRLQESGAGFEGMQRDFTILFMPTFVLNLLLLVLRPWLTQLSVYWAERKMTLFYGQIKRVCLLLLGLESLVLFAGYVFGLPILGWVYQLDLLDYQLSFMILLVGGGFNLFAALIDNIMTIYRKQLYLLLSNGLTFLLSKYLTTHLVEQHAILGAALSFLCSMLVYFVTSLLIYLFIRSERLSKK